MKLKEHTCLRLCVFNYDFKKNIQLKNIFSFFLLPDISDDPTKGPDPQVEKHWDEKNEKSHFKYINKS